MTTSSSGFFHGFLKGAERPCPHLIEVRTQPGYAFRVELIEPACSCFGVGHEAHIFEHLEVLGYCGTRYGEHARELVDGDGSRGEL